MHRTKTLANISPEKAIQAFSSKRLKRVARMKSNTIEDRSLPSDLGRGTRVRVAIIYGLTTVIPFLVMVYILHSHVLSASMTDLAWIATLLLIALAIALLGGKMMKELWGKVGKAVEMIGRFQDETDHLPVDERLRSTDEIDRIPSVVTRLVDVAKKQMNELKEYSEKVELLNNKLTEANQRLRQISIEDSLSGLYNRRYFDDRIGHEISRTKRFGRDLALMMIDIDFFKQYNDDTGHPIGDKALASIGTIIRNSVRETDLPFRYGGDEFAIILPETDIESAAFVAERIRSEVERYRFQKEPAESESPLTVSVGVSMLGRGCSTAEEFVSTADKALYRAKSAGRNKVIAYSETE
jgi:diguanylate cyclase (GGDEF)-like protein